VRVWPLPFAQSSESVANIGKVRLLLPVSQRLGARAHTDPLDCRDLLPIVPLLLTIMPLRALVMLLKFVL
jgi:hypothetical protein